MMRLLISVLLLIISINTHSQSYIQYFNSCNRGDSLFHYKRYADALHWYESAFDSVPFIHSKYLQKAAVCASRLKDQATATEYLKMVLKQGDDSKFIHTGKRKLYLKLPEYKMLKDSLQGFDAYSKKLHNREFQWLIDSLYIIDQDSIRTRKTKNPLYNTRKDDSLNFSSLIKFIDKYGYPSERIVGQDRNEKAFILILHWVRAHGNESYLELVERALMNGDCLPEDYAWIVEDSHLFKGLEPAYYFNNEKVLTMSEEQKRKVNAERRKIGMKPLEAYKIFKMGNIVGMSEKW